MGMINFGNKIRELRLKNKMSQSEVAAYMGTSPSVISELELGKYESKKTKFVNHDYKLFFSDLFKVKPIILTGALNAKDPKEAKKSSKKYQKKMVKRNKEYTNSNKENVEYRNVNLYDIKKKICNKINSMDMKNNCHLALIQWVVNTPSDEDYFYKLGQMFAEFDSMTEEDFNAIYELVTVTRK